MGSRPSLPARVDRLLPPDAGTPSDPSLLVGELGRDVEEAVDGGVFVAVSPDGRDRETRWRWGEIHESYATCGSCSMSELTTRPTPRPWAMLPRRSSRRPARHGLVRSRRRGRPPRPRRIPGGHLACARTRSVRRAARTAGSRHGRRRVVYAHGYAERFVADRSLADAGWIGALRRVCDVAAFVVGRASIGRER